MNQDIVIIGGGVIGLSVAYHLAKKGVTNVTLLERNELTSGTSWHAAGIVGPLRSSQNLTTLAKYAVDLFQWLEDDTGQATGYKQTGGLWLATDNQRMIELQRIAAMGKMNALTAEIIDPQQVAERLSCLRHDDLTGALWVEEDGQVNPVDLCMAYAKGAKKGGVSIREHCGVKTVRTRHGRVDAVELDNGDLINCNRVINCAGLWARKLALSSGVQVPLQAVEHIYVVTEPVDQLPAPCPIVRDLDHGIYLKEDTGKLVLGTFEQNAKLWDEDSVAPNHSYLMFDEDWAHVEPMLKAGIHRIPQLAQTGIQRFMNGPESFTPDTRQIMGQSPDVTGYFVAAGFNSIGIMSSAGVGKVMADWVIDSHSPMDLWEVDLQRFSASDNDPEFLKDRIAESVHNQFSMHWPFKQATTGRNRKKSPWHDSINTYQPHWGAPTGWERPLWFPDNQPIKSTYSHQQQSWWPTVKHECVQLMQTGAWFELSPFSKFAVEGKQATAFLQHVCSRDIDMQEGHIRYCLMLNQQGGIEAEITVSRIGVDRFWLIGAAATRIKDLHWLRAHSQNFDIEITDITDHHSVIAINGPNAIACLSSLCDHDFSHAAFPFSSSQQINIGGLHLRANRISYAGEDGWELFVPVENANALFTALKPALERFDIQPAGLFALESCRLEKAFRHWGHDMGPDDNPYQVGLSFTLDRHGTFIGANAIAELRRHPPTRKLQQFSIDWRAQDKACPLLLHDEPVWLNDSIVGRTTSGGLGFRTDTALSFAMINQPASPPVSPESSYEIEVAGERYIAEPLDTAIYDPGNTKLTGTSVERA